MRLAVDEAAIRRGWVWPIKPFSPRPSSRQILGNWVVLPEPVSPLTMTTWWRRSASAISWRRPETGSSSGKVTGGSGLRSGGAASAAGSARRGVRPSRPSRPLRPLRSLRGRSCCGFFCGSAPGVVVGALVTDMRPTLYLPRPARSGCRRLPGPWCKLRQPDLALPVMLVGPMVPLCNIQARNLAAGGAQAYAQRRRWL